MTEAQINALASQLLTLEASKRSNPRAWFGTKSKNGGPWSGSGLADARRILEALNNSPPGNLASQATQDAYRKAVAAASALTAG